MHRIRLWIALFALVGCFRTSPDQPITTAPEQSLTEDTSLLPSPTAGGLLPLEPTLIQPTLNVNDENILAAPVSEYVVQAGDTLSGIAAAHSVSVAALLDANTIANPDVLAVGQVLQLPNPPAETSSTFKIIPDNRLVRGPGSRDFQVEQFISQQQGYIRLATDEVNGDLLTAAQIIERAALEFSVDPRLLLALLELRSRWLSDSSPTDEAKIRPLGAQASPLGFDRDGLYRQITWAADQLNAGYYGSMYRGLETIEFEDGGRIRFASGLNAGTIGVQYMLSQFNSYGIWEAQISPDGLYRIYVDYFGDPFVNALEPVVPSGLTPPELLLPFAEDEVWFYTGGPHGGWGSGSAWAAIDFAPPDDLTDIQTACYVSDSWATAVAPGVIARTATGVVVLDLDGDGDESTGWSILYLHLAAEGQVEVNTVVDTGDRLGRPSCEGGFSNGTHLHIARRYNGEWVPAACENCDKSVFSLGNWSVIGLPGQEYQGFLQRGAERRIAEQGRLTPDNLVSW